ncbi:MAG TPA: hypothetical protein VFM94_00875 [Solirubrobacterales bacterium]|nr:hypothetical protein [Solirubrobacterales bacterium]
MGSQLTATIGASSAAVRYWLGGLESFSLVEELADPDGGEPLYAATLEEHSYWVRITFEALRARRRLDSE